MKFLCLTFFISMNAFSATYDCDLMDGTAAWQRVTVRTNAANSVHSVSLSDGLVGDKAVQLVCKEIEEQTYSCGKKLKEIVIIKFEESNLTLKTPGSDEAGLYECL